MTDNHPRAAARITVETVGDTLVARAQAKLLDEDALEALAEAIDQASEAGTPGTPALFPRVVIDLASVSILPSSALGPLVQIADRCQARKQELTLAAIQPQVRRVFAITRLDHVFQLVPNLEAARL